MMVLALRFPTRQTDHPFRVAVPAVTSTSVPGASRTGQDMRPFPSVVDAAGFRKLLSSHRHLFSAFNSAPVAYMTMSDQIAALVPCQVG